MPTPGTTPTPIRLTEADKAKFELIRERFGLPSLAAAIRYAGDRLYLELTAGRPKGKGKPG